MDRSTVKAPSGLIHLKDMSNNRNTIAVKKLSDYEDLVEQGRLIELPCAIGSEVYVLAECRNISPQLDGTLYSSDGSPGTATGYYCPYDDDCPHINISDDCDKCKDITAIFKDEVKSVVIDDLGVRLFTDACGNLLTIVYMR